MLDHRIGLAVVRGLVEAMGWANFFVLTFVAALPGLWLAWRMRARIDAVDGSRNGEL